MLSSKTLLAFALLALLALVGRVASEETEDHGQVHVLTSDNFDDFVAADLTLVEFYAPWCGHCKSLAPHYKEAASILMADGIALGKVDATVQGDLATRFGVQGYPTLKVFRKGKDTAYKGPRSAEGIVAYMRKQSGPSVKTLEQATVDSTVEFVLQADPTTHVAVLGFFPEDSDLKVNYERAADQLRDSFVFGQVTGEAAGKVLKGIWEHAKAKGTVPSLPAVMVVHTIGTTPTAPKMDFVVRSSQDSTDMAKWVEDNVLPLVGQFNEPTSSLYFKKGLPVVKLYAAVDWTSSANAKLARYYLVRMRKALSGLDGLLGALVDKEVSEGASELVSAGVDVDSGDFFVVIDDLVKEEKYVMPTQGNAWDTNAVRQFAEDFLAGKLTPYVRSEPEPTAEEIAAEPVRKVVGTNLEDVLFNEGKSVLFEIYAPWCGHCKSLEPKYKAAAEKLAKFRDQVTLAKLDGTVNDFPRDLFDVTGYPSIFWIQDGDRDSITPYTGGREVADIVRFVKTQAKLGKKKN